MNRLLLILIGIAFVATTEAQEKYTLEDMNVIGKVKSIQETGETVDSNYLDCNGNSLICNENPTYNFNKSGKLVEKINLSDCSDSEKKTLFIYGDNGMLLKKMVKPVEFYTWNIPKKYSKKSSEEAFYNYNDSGFVETIVKFKDSLRGDTSEVRWYNKILNKETSIQLDWRNDNETLKSEVKERREIKYDSNGNKIECETFDNNGVSLYLMKYKYNEQSKLIKIEEEGCYEDKFYKCITVFEYDIYGGMTKENCFFSLLGSFDESDNYTRTMINEYDDKKNWFSIIEKGERFFSSRKRIIEYYE